MSTEKPTAAESAQWHRERAASLHRQSIKLGIDSPEADRRAAHHEAAAEALDLLVEIASFMPSGRTAFVPSLTVNQWGRLRALVEGR